jgi:hypothetical protein
VRSLFTRDAVGRNLLLSFGVDIYMKKYLCSALLIGLLLGLVACHSAKELPGTAGDDGSNAGEGGSAGTDEAGEGGASGTDEPVGGAGGESGTAAGNGGNGGSSGSGGDPGSGGTSGDSGEGGGAGHPSVDGGTAETGRTYYKDVRPLIAQHCLECHTVGGIGPFQFDSYEAVSSLAPTIFDAVNDGRMPPWPARQDCHPLRDVRSLAVEEIQIIADWIANDTAEGDPADYVEPMRMTRDLGTPTVQMDAGEGYVPDASLDDEYRCFVLDGTFEEDTFVTAMDIIPGVREQVHHVQIHRIPGSSIASARSTDAAAPGLGYQCFGGVGVTGSENMFSWRPGATAIVFEEGDAGFIEAGSGVVIQVHYNNQFIPIGESPKPDLTKIALWTMPEGELPDRIVTRTGTTSGVNIPAGDADVVSESSRAMSSVSTVGAGFLGVGGTYIAGEIIGMTPHMHSLGTRLSSEIVRADGTRSCMVDVPNWSFEWQLDYLFNTPVTYATGDRLTIKCEYDNSPENQPVINGEQVTPRNITWGEGSLDEMCLNYVWVRYPRQAFFDAL